MLKFLWNYVKGRPFKTAFTLLVLVPLAAFGAYLWHYVYFNRDNLPNIQTLVNFEPPTVGTIYDQNSKTVINLAKEFRWISKPEEISETVKQAFLSAEDRRFYDHNGVDWWALFFRATGKNLEHIAKNIYHGKRPFIQFQQGASTLDQQLVRLFFLPETVKHEGSSPINKVWRKIDEWRLAIWVNKELKKPEYFGSKQKAKDHIFACLVSYAYFKGVYGIKAASLFYFDKDIKDLQPEEAALLAGIMKNPLVYAPSKEKPENPNKLTHQIQMNRRNAVLTEMVENGYLTKEAADKLKEVDLPTPNIQNINIRTDAPSVVGDIFKEVREHQLDTDKIFDGQIQIHTTVSLEVQKIVNQALENGIKIYEDRHPEARGLTQGAVVVLRNSDGAILAEVGGRQFFKSKPVSYSDFNRAKYSYRQPGSAFKPFVYLTAFKNGWDLNKTVLDSPISVPMGWHQPRHWIKNYDGKYKGLIPARKALAESRNAAAVWLTRQNGGIGKVMETAEELGVKSKLEPYITTALGASDINLLELANAYRGMASYLQAEPYMVSKITSRNRDIIFERERQIQPLTIDLAAMNSIQEGLRGVVRLPSGTGHSLDNKDFHIPVAGKTGTTNDFKDAWFIGWTYGPDGVTIGVKIGFDEPSIGYDDKGVFGTGPGRGLGPKETGGRTALPIFKQIMLGVYVRGLVGSVPQFPEDLEKNIDIYLSKN